MLHNSVLLVFIRFYSSQLMNICNRVTYSVMFKDTVSVQQDPFTLFNMNMSCAFNKFPLPVKLSRFSARQAQTRMPIVVISHLWDAHTHNQWHARTQKGAMLCEL